VSEFAARLRALRWRMRRGTAELDTLFARWLEQHGGIPDEAELVRCEQLLGMEDDVLQDLLILGKKSTDPKLQELVDAFRSSAVP
jgi:antitoxin CptB